MISILDRLSAAGIDLPTPPAPAANYVPYLRAGNVLTISGQLPMENGELLYKGKLGDNISIEEGQAAARLCAINILAQANASLDGDLSRIQATMRLGGFVNSAPDFTDQPKVINGASDLIAQILGDAGKHARAAVGVAALPFGVSVEIEAQFYVSE